MIGESARAQYALKKTSVCFIYNLIKNVFAQLRVAQ